MLDERPVGGKGMIHETAIVDEGAEIGEGTSIWHWTHVMPGAHVGKNCSIGQNCFIGSKAVIGDNVRIQNNVSVYDLVTLENNVFVGPSAVFTNDYLPPSGGEAWLPTIVKRGAAIGANATIICGVVLGEGCLIGAGAVVTRDVPAGMVYSGVPARIMGAVEFRRKEFSEKRK
jgi:UDP-2-acetamido-3-amino-2,3-dideoxy-glucuronate N-acetyltransferase